MNLIRKKFTGKVFFGTGCSSLLKENICKRLRIKPGKVKIKTQNDGELWVKYCENIRGYDVYIVQPTHMPYRNFFELVTLADAALRSSAGQITLVVPYLLHTRQERKDEPRVALTAKLGTKFISVSGADRILLLDLHAPAIQGFFDENVIRVDEIYASIEFMKIINGSIKINPKETVFISPDIGAIRKARFFAEKFGAGLAFIDKKRTDHGQSDSLSVTLEIGDTLKGKIGIFIDDLVDTGGSLVKAATLVAMEGCKKVYAFVTHPVLSKDAIRNIEDSKIDEFFITDSISRDLCLSSKIKVVSLGSLFGDSIRITNQEHGSLSVLF